MNYAWVIIALYVIPGLAGAWKLKPVPPFLQAIFFAIACKTLLGWVDPSAPEPMLQAWYAGALIGYCMGWGIGSIQGGTWDSPEGEGTNQESQAPHSCSTPEVSKVARKANGGVCPYSWI